ncbi:MAG: hypothetical protein ACI4PF_02790, partial [Christensenellales bacterium]
MEFKKRNWNSILNNWITSITLILATLFLSVCFLMPSIKANASITQSDINEYNIHFVSAKTKARSANGINKVLLNEQKGSGSVAPEFYTYQYNYNPYTDTQLYYGTNTEIVSNISGTSSYIEQILYTAFDNGELTYDRNYGYIPYGINYFDNANGEKEKVFYDNIDNGDYVLINNYNLSTNDTFNVENFYLSFGSPYIDEYTTTPLASLRVEGKLYSEGRVHDLALNTPEISAIDKDNSLNAYYWNQYFDLKNLQGYETNEIGSTTYNIENQQGRYDITFYFIRYQYDKNNNLQPVSDTEQEFTYSFYLLDGTEYSNYPTINNAEILADNLTPNGTNEYFYHFTKDNPYIEYDPTKYNLAYSRANNKISTSSQTITSNFVNKTYTIDEREGRKFPLGIITYYNGNKVVKEVYILTNYNDNKTLVEYLYLSVTNPSGATAVPTSYSAFLDAVNNGRLDFEYKITTIRSVTSDEFNTYNFRSTSFNNCQLIFTDVKYIVDETKLFDSENNLIANVDELVDTYSISVSADNEYTITHNNGTPSKIATLGSAPTTEELISNITSGIILNKNTLEVSSDTEISNNTTKYTLPNPDDVDGKKVYTLKKSYIDAKNDNAEIDIILSTETVGENIIKDPIDTNITIKYVVDTNNTITSIVFTIINKFPILSLGSDVNLKLLNYLLYPSEIDLNYTYQLKLNELGIYNITYSYVCPSENNKYYINSTNKETSNIYYSNSTNYTTPTDFATPITDTTSNTIFDNENTETLYAIMSGFIGEEIANQITLNGITFTYSPTKETIQINNNPTEYSLNVSYTISPFSNDGNDTQVETIFKVDNVSGRYKLSVLYKFGTLSTKTETTIQNTQINNKSGYRTYNTTITTYTYTLDFDSTNIPDTNNWKQFKDILVAIEQYHKITEEGSEYQQTTKSTSVEETKQGENKLHIYGSITYFNKVDSYTDSGYAKLEQVDSRLNLNYASDVTKLYISKNNASTSFTSTTANASIFKGNVASLLNKNNIIITDVTPILWNNFSTLAYNSKKSMSYIYRYTDYSFDNDGNILYDSNTAIISTYTKDTYCQFDGLYEIVVFYTYDNLPNNVSSNIYYQVFTFIIDNSSPTLNIEVENENGEYESLGLNTYTNKNVRLSWEVPTYFKNDIYVEINKSYYNATNSAYNFVSIYRQKTITTTIGNSSYVNSISEMDIYRKEINGTERDFYYVDLKLKSGADSSYNLNGKYKVIMHYNANGKSTFTEEFIIDKQNISGLNILAVVKNNNGSYSVSKGEQFGNSQIINSDFTFRFNPKESGAGIFVYYDKIDFISTKDYDNIVSASDGYGITTKFNVNGDKISTGTPYVYNYNHLSDYYNVESNNLLTSNNSSLFLFRLEDEAGNTCRYVVFYDNTEPRFLISPEPDKVNHVINDTTRVVWGDYKAIKVSTSSELVIDNLNTKVDNYSKETDETDKKLNLILRYINTNSYFNDLKVEKIGDDYYILVPVTNTTIKDYEYGNTKEITETTEYYFFPTNPIETEDGVNYVTLPTFSSNGKVVVDSYGKVVKSRYEVVSNGYTISSLLDYNNQAVSRYITITYYTDSTKNSTATILGAIGEGQYIYSVYDKLNNKTSGLIWMNLDKTQTMAYGLFDYSDNLNNAQPLIIDETTYSASKLFISSLNSTVDEAIPDYTVTSKYYAYDASLYIDYNVTNIELLNSTNTPSITNNNEIHLQITLEHKTQAGVTKVVKVQLTDEDGNEYPKYSYPYSLEGSAVVADTNGEPLDIYSEGYSYLNNDQTRKYSLALNTTTDTNRQKVVTDEGLYIFKRTYTDENIDQSVLGTDSRIIYRVYYIDRSGIINITTSSSVASKLYNIGSNIGFTLGSNYLDTNYQKEINAKTIQNNQSSVTSNNSNANYVSSELFNTNKIQVEFTMSYDKHNFVDFVSQNEEIFKTVVNNTDLTTEEKNNLKTILSNTLFNTRKFSSNVYKVELDLRVGGNNTTGTVIINERDNYYSQSAMSAYLKGTPMVDSKTRSNVFDFFYDTGSNYYLININDQAGYVKFNDDQTISDSNYLANNLKITFDITHDAPEGDLYGKYYGRHDYDNNSEISSNPSIPIENGTYAILSKYLQEGQLEPLSDSEQSIEHSVNGDYVKLYSTNNETMIFTFSITKDEYQAQIDPNNIKIYKGATEQANLIFNRVDGNNIDTTLVSASRQKKAFVQNEINGTIYYAIIIFDNNLDEILDDDEKDLYSEFRLLDAKDNIDKETYYIQINYVGNANDYIGEDSLGNPLSFYKTTYEIIVDRIKPMYNLTKLMALDKYTYNTIDTKVTTSNYEDVFNKYQSVYNFTLDKAQDFYRSDLENYFFALDCRETTGFAFESIDNLDNNKSLYIRLVNKDNYKFSVTPDDYKAYYNAVYLQGHPQFTPSNATVITNDTFPTNSTLEENKYYHIQFTLDGNDDNSISAYYLKNRGIFKENNYYEIIEADETGNYRVYAIYIPEQSSSKVVYTYQKNSNIASEETVTILYGNNPFVESKGMELKFTKIQLKDNFLRANIEISTNKITHLIDIILDPITLMVTVTNRTTNTIMWQYNVGSKDKDGYANTDTFVEAINYILDYYYSLINDKTHSYYSEYGYNVKIDIVDRIGISVKDMKILYNYEINYVVAGSVLSPIFIDNNTNFTMRLEGQKGSTYLTDITVYKFNKVWTQINVDNSSNPKIFDLSEEELKNPIDYLFTRGVYKFVFTDNFNRVNEFFHEYGISSSQTGGSLSYGGDKVTLSDGYTYSANQIEYTYDSSVYNVYIKFVGKYLNEFSEYVIVDDAKNEIIYNSSLGYSEDALSRYYGITIITSGNITTITFHGVKDNSTPSGTTDLSKYHIKTILASTSDNYTWGDELTNKDIFVYDKKIALYTAVQDVSIRNLSGNTLDTSEHLNLTEDFELVTTWKNSVSYSERFDLNSRIILTRTYNDNGTIKTTTSRVTSGQIISQPGDYTAYVINDLGMTSRAISFTRGEGEISMYA